MSSKQSKYEIERILTSQDGGIADTRGIGGILARLWRQILRDINVRPSRFEMLLSDFINDAKRKVPDNRVSKLFTRGNLRRELERPTMTFKVFMKGIKMLNVAKIRIAVELEFGSGKKTLHQTVVDLGNKQHDIDIFDSEDIQ